MPSAEIIADDSTPRFRGEGIEAQRACRILGVCYRTLMRLIEGELIEWHYSDKLSWKRVRYNSVVVFCDRLRVEYGIADRRPVLPAHYQRHRDEDLLPFPLQDTMGAQKALAALGYAKTDSLVRLIKARCFDAYQLTPLAPWRVSRSSLGAYLSSRRRAPAPDDYCVYKVGDVTAHF